MHSSRQSCPACFSGALGCDGFNCCVRVDAESAPLKHAGQDCLEECIDHGEFSSACRASDFCGAGGLCCARGGAPGFAQEGCGNLGCEGRHCCVAAIGIDTPVLNGGEECWNRCEMGSGGNERHGGACGTGTRSLQT